MSSSTTGSSPRPQRAGTPTAPGVRLRGVTKVFDRNPAKAQWRSALNLKPRPRVAHRALDGIDLDIDAGQSLAVLGPNGAGKSTLLRLVAGVTRPSAGSIEVAGSVGAMIELGIGFHPDLTGRENTFSSLVIHGLEPAAIADAYPEIVDFAGIEDAMDTPMKHYSLGMAARLGFAVATHRRPAVLAVDEVITAGDRHFQERCLDRISRMVDEGTILMFVTHQMSFVTAVCQRAIRLEAGRIVDDDAAGLVVERYLRSARGIVAEPRRTDVTIRRITTPPEIAPRSQLSVCAELEVGTTVETPHLQLDLSLPVVAPDVVTVSVSTPLPTLVEPGRYRVTGTTTPIAAEGVRYRATLSARDAAGRALGNQLAAEFDVTGGVSGAVPRFTGEVHSRITELPHEADRFRPTAPTAPDDIVRVRGVTKTFSTGLPRAELAKALPFRVPPGSLTALDGVDLNVGRGEALGLIGPNGAGKSTLLRILAGITAPDRGTVEITGNPVSMLGLGMGLHRDFTGRANIALMGRILGIDETALKQAEHDILDLAGLGSAIDAPVRQYSSGMSARLGLALSMFCPGDLLLIDELLSVGDEQFREATLHALQRRRADGDTVIFVSHELQLVERVCDRVVWLQAGAIVDDGPTPEVLERYGHRAWAAGVNDATSGIRLGRMSVPRRHIETGGALEFSGTLLVDEPLPHARLEVSYRLAPDDRFQPLTVEERLARTIFIATLEPAQRALSVEGRYRYDAQVVRNDWVGDVDLVVCVIDERDNTVLAETYEPVTVGRSTNEGFPMLAVSAEWSVERLSGADV